MRQRALPDRGGAPDRAPARVGSDRGRGGRARCSADGPARRHRVLPLRRGREPDGGGAVQGELVDGGVGAGQAALVPRAPDPVREQPARGDAGADGSGDPRRGLRADRGGRQEGGVGQQAAEPRRAQGGAAPLRGTGRGRGAGRSAVLGGRRGGVHGRPVDHEGAAEGGPVPPVRGVGGAAAGAAPGGRVVRGLRLAEDGRRAGADDAGHVRAAGGGRRPSPEGRARRGRAAGGAVPVLPLARGVPGRLPGRGARRAGERGGGVERRVRRRAREPAVGTDQAAGEGVVRRAPAGDCGGAERGGAATDDRRAGAGRSRALRGLSRRPAGSGRGEPVCARVGPLSAVRARGHQHVCDLRRADARGDRARGEGRLRHSVGHRDGRYDEGVLPRTDGLPCTPVALQLLRDSRDLHRHG